MEGLAGFTAKRANFVFALFFALLAVSSGLAQGPPEQGKPIPEQDERQPEGKKHPREEWINHKATEKAKEKVKKRLVDLTTDFEKEKSDIEYKIARETDADKRAALEEKLRASQAEFEGKKEQNGFLLKILEIFPVENPTRGANDPLMTIGNCTYSTRHSGDGERVIASKGEPQDCRYFHSRFKFGIRINNPSSAVMSSSCWVGDAFSGEYIFDEAPSAMIFYYWDSKKAGEPPIVVFVDMSIIKSYSVGNYTDDERDRTLLTICPPGPRGSLLQAHRPQAGDWHQLNFAANRGDDYDTILSNLFSGMGRSRAGFEGVESAKAQSVDKFSTRNAVFDLKFIDYINRLQESWSKIENIVLPELAPKEKGLKTIKELGSGIEKVAGGNVSGEGGANAIGKLAASCEAQPELGGMFLGYAKELRRAEKAFRDGNDKEARKILKKFAKKQLEKDEKRLEKEIAPLARPFNKAQFLLGRWEFVLAGGAMKDVAKNFPDESRREEIRELADAYMAPAKEAQDYLEKLKWQFAKERNEGETAEPIRIEAGKEVVFFPSLTGGRYDFERNAPRWKIILRKSFIPADVDGTVDKKKEPIVGAVFGLFDTDQFIKSGLDTAIVETKNGTSAISAIKGKVGGRDEEIRLLSSFGGSREDVPLSVLRDQYNLRWLRIAVAAGNDTEESLIPPVPDQYLNTFYFTDKDGSRITVFSLKFVTENKIFWKLRDDEKSEPLEFTYFLYPGLYRYRAFVVDMLEEDPFKRVAEVELPEFRVLYPDKK